MTEHPVATGSSPESGSATGHSRVTRAARAPGDRAWVVALAAWLALAVTPAAAELTSQERAITAAIDARSPAAVTLLQTLVDINSGTLNFGGVREVGRLVDAELRDLGFETEWVDGSEFGRAGHVIGHRPGGPLHVLLIGHLDTVFEPDSPFQNFEPLPDHRAGGPGTTDMKGGLVVMLEALRALESAGALSDLTVTAVVTGDEESSGRPLHASRSHLLDAGIEADIALGFEDGDGRFDTAVIARRGSTQWTLEVVGTPAHSSQIFTETVGFGAIYEAARILDAFRTELADEPNLTFNPGLVLGGSAIESGEQDRGTASGKNNIVAARAVVRGDLRAVSPEQLERAIAVMHEIAGDNLPGTEASLSIDPGYPPMAPTEGNRRLLELFDLASRDLGLGPVRAVDPRDAGAADISFVAADVEMALDGLGLMGTGGHTEHEVADLETLTGQAARVAVVLYRLGSAAR